MMKIVFSPSIDYILRHGIKRRLYDWKLPFEYTNEAIEKELNMLWIPKEEGYGYISHVSDYAGIENYPKIGGGAFKNRFGVVVFPGDSPEDIELRIIHEYLHSQGIDSDKMYDEYLPKWTKYIVERSKILRNYFQRRYYKKLLGGIEHEN